MCKRNQKYEIVCKSIHKYSIKYLNILEKYRENMWYVPDMCQESNGKVLVKNWDSTGSVPGKYHESAGKVQGKYQ